MHNKIIYPVAGLILLLLSLSVIFTAISKPSTNSTNLNTNPSLSSTDSNVINMTGTASAQSISGSTAVVSDISSTVTSYNTFPENPNLSISANTQPLGLKVDDGDDDGQIVEIKVTNPDNIQNLNYTEPKG